MTRKWITETETSEPRRIDAMAKRVLARGGVVIGTSGSLDYLRDPNGGRRFWPDSMKKETSRMPFMLEIEAAQRSPLEQLALDYFMLRSGQPTIDFCRQALGVSENDEIVARRLGVATSTVRGWREVGRRARGGSP